MNQNPAEGANMGNKEEIKANIFEKFAMAKKASARNMTGAEDLLSAMSVTSNQDATPEIKTPHKTHWQQIFMVCCCILVIAAAAKAFLYLNAEISAVVKELSALESQLATTDTKGQLPPSLPR
jgi:hypothetical protein